MATQTSSLATTATPTIPDVVSHGEAPAEVETGAGPDDHTYKFDVTMSCGGCSGAIERVLGKLDGVKSYTVSLPSQTALVTAGSDLSYETVLRTIKKTGKKVVGGQADGVVMGIDVD